MPGISREELAKVHYIQNIPTDGRAVVLNSYFDAKTKEWFMYIDANGKLMQMKGQMVRGTYWCAVPANPERDLDLPLATLIDQHLSFPKILGSF